VIGDLASLMEDDTMSRDFWLSSGSRYAGANEIFLAQSAPVYLSGNWQVAQFASSADFDWAVVPNACDVRCGGFPGAKVMTVFERGGDADLAAIFVAWMNDTEQQRRMDEAANFLPTRVDLAEEGLDYPVRGDDMKVFLAELDGLPADTYASAASPQFNTAATELVDLVSEVVGGRLTADEAAERLDAELETLVGEGAR
jgi:alpha-1,4-digalacturonate transport system substrate-binding protein